VLSLRELVSPSSTSSEFDVYSRQFTYSGGETETRLLSVDVGRLLYVGRSQFLQPVAGKIYWHIGTKTWTPFTEFASELYRPSDRRLSAKLVPTFADRGCHVVSTTDFNYHFLGLLDRSRYFFFQVAPQLYWRGWVDPVPNPLPLRKVVASGIEPGPLDLYPGTLTTRPQRRSV
jgi:hypothetical protein